MRARGWQLAALLAACAALSCRMQEDGASTGTATADPAADPPPRQAAPSTPSGHVVVEHPPADGDVAPIVKAEVEKAEKAGRRLVVYEGATWCHPCQQLHQAVERGDLDSAFPELTLLEFDADKDGERLLNAGYTSKYIPLLALPRADGTASGKQFSGGTKGDNNVAILSGKLRELLANR
jgi:thiol-disulfide isomerase/thioredoxin